MRWLLRCAIVVGATGLALCVVEAALRLTSADRYRSAPTPPWAWITSDPVLVRANVPGFESEAPPVTIGSLGFRGPDPILPKPPGTVRIVCLGDSTTFGVYREGPFSISTRTSYPAELGRLAAERGLAHVEVVNAGVLGYTSAEGLVMLVSRVLAVEPDVVTLRFGNNDHVRARGNEPEIASSLEYAAMRALPRALFGFEVVRLGFYAYRQYGPTRDAGLPKVSLEQFERNLHRLIDTATSHGVRVLLLDFPLRTTPGPNSRWPDWSGARSLPELLALHARYEMVVDRVARMTATPFVRTAPAFAHSPDPPFPDWDISHPNEVGHRIIAEHLLREVLERGWLNRPVAPPA